MDVSLEDDMSNDLPNAVELYKYARQKVYAILFDLGPKRAIVKQNPSQSGEYKPLVRSGEAYQKCANED